MKFNLKEMQKRGQAGVNKTITFLIGGLLVVVFAVALAPEIFTSVGQLENATGVPTWMPLIVGIGVAIGIVLLILRAFGITK